MKKKAKIIGVKVGVDGNLDDYFDGFHLFDYGYVDIDHDSIPEIEDITQDEVLDWAREQYGKFMFFDDLRPASYIATGKTYIA